MTHETTIRTNREKAEALDIKAKRLNGYADRLAEESAIARAEADQAFAERDDLLESANALEGAGVA